MPTHSAERRAAQHDEHCVRLVPVVTLAPFYQLYRGLEREGPGEDTDVAWAVAQAGVGPQAQICDVACGSGADIAPLQAACPKGHVFALDKQAHFVDEARVRIGDDPRIDLLRPDAGDKLTAVLDQSAEEIAVWRAHGDDYGYLLSVVRPK